jgi:hypothetical protein
MAETSFEVRYDGEALRAGRMEVRELAPALFALSELFTDASRLLYPDNEPVALEIEATREGSFIVELVLHAVGSGWDQLSHMDVAKDAGQLALFKELVIGDSIDFSLFGLIKRLKGKTVVKEADGPGPDETTLVDQGGREVVVKSDVARLAADENIRRELRDVVEPLKREGVDTLEVTSGARATVRLESADAPSFEAPAALDDPELLSEQVLDDVYLEVKTAELEKGSARKWRFGGIGGNFTATIEDPEFMQKVARHEVVFGTGDQLRAQVRITQRRDPGTGKIKQTRRITKVHEWIKAPEQLRMVEGLLDPGSGDGPGPRRLGTGDPASAGQGGG